MDVYGHQEWLKVMSISRGEEVELMDGSTGRKQQLHYGLASYPSRLRSCSLMVNCRNTLRRT